MLNKIFASLIFICLCIAIPLAVMGIHHVDLGPSTIAFLNQTSTDLKSWQLVIPKIPDIPQVPQFSTNGFWETMVNILNAIVNFFNFIVGLINVFISVLNYIINLIQYLFTLVKNFIAYRDTLSRMVS